MDRLLWQSPPGASAPEENLTFEFEFADQLLPDVYKLLSVDAAADADSAMPSSSSSDDWVLFTDVSATLAVKTADALTKLLDDESAVTALTAAQFSERVVLRKTLGHSGSGNYSSDPEDDDVAETNKKPAGDEKIFLVRYDSKLKQLLGVDAYTVS